MKIFKDTLSNDEVASDTYPIEVIHDAVYKIKIKRVTESCDIDESAIGGNASAEGGDEGGADSSSISGYDIVLNHKLQACDPPMTKAQFKGYIKTYMKDVVKKLAQDNPDRVAAFQKGATTFVKEMLGDYKEYEMFVGESMNWEAALVYIKWDEEQPYAYLFKDGIEEEKV